MSLYDLPKFKKPKIASFRNFFKRFKQKKEAKGTKMPKFRPRSFFWIIILVIFLSSGFGFLAGFIANSYFYQEVKEYFSKLNIQIPDIQKIVEQEVIYIPQTSQEEKIIKVVEEFSPAVVSIIITKDVPILEEYYANPFEGFEEFFDEPFKFQVPQYRQKGTEKKEIGGGTGFIISEEGMILTNKHVVEDLTADYTVFLTDGRKLPAKVLARDPVQDLAIIKIEKEKIINQEGELGQESFPTVKLGDSSKLQIGQSIIAIGNALGEFRNTVSVGVISGLGRTVTASGEGIIVTLEDVIQTDAAINKGNSGGPLLNLNGEVIGINFAMAQAAENIGFAIPVNKAKKDIEQFKTLGKIVYPYLGVYYTLVTENLQKYFDLPVDYGAWIGRNTSGQSTEIAVISGAPAEKAGLKRDDIILEFNNEKITGQNTLAKIIMKYNPGDKISLKILRDGKEKNLQAILDERSEETPQ